MKKIPKKNQEQRQAEILKDLIDLAKTRKYKNPQYWAIKIIQTRINKSKTSEKNTNENI